MNWAHTFMHKINSPQNGQQSVRVFKLGFELELKLIDFIETFIRQETF